MTAPIRFPRWGLAIVMLAAAAWAIDLWRPFDGRTRNSWREADDAAIARNFYREGMNILYPRIDWRGNGPGYAEMEFPILSWTMAAGYSVVGVRPELGRVIAYVASIVGLVAFLSLAAGLLPPVGVAAAGVFFALSPLVTRVANALQPEPIMMACLLVATFAFVRWVETDEWWAYGLAMLATALAVLAKSPAAHIGIAFTTWLLLRRGTGALRDARIWIFAIGALAPAALWYRHAYDLWLHYGNSLGVSNEAHWIGPDILAHPKYFAQLLSVELRYVWVWLAVPVALYGIIVDRRSPVVQWALCWLGAVALYYVLAIRTTSQDWAAYYHVATVPVAALLFGAGVAAVATRPLGAPVTLAVVALALATYAQEARRIWADRHPNAFAFLYADAMAFAPLLPPHDLVLVSGGMCTDALGHPLAVNASYMFYWTDHKGFNICRDRQSMSAVDSIARLGATFYIAEKDALRQAPGAEAALRQRYRVAADGAWAILFDLRNPVTLHTP
ncbi:MAG TPA: glycosyltransferase family 39 protein [Gemmatimonadaceae bacterium]|nr:glycosyltransferase family 39 protein [Gemmatimonadaceae bacterium]